MKSIIVFFLSAVQYARLVRSAGRISSSLINPIGYFAHIASFSAK